MSKPCVFFDRDGIVNASPGPGYVESWTAFRLMPDFPAVLRTVTEHDRAAVIVSNQRGVALGRMTRAAVDAIHANLRALLRREHGLELLDILYCPHERDTCACRKPQPGMLLAAAQRHALELASSWMVGDAATDMEAGRRAGCRTIYVGTDAAVPADIRVPDMAALRRRIAAILST